MAKKNKPKLRSPADAEARPMIDLLVEWSKPKLEELLAKSKEDLKTARAEKKALEKEWNKLLKKVDPPWRLKDFSGSTSDYYRMRSLADYTDPGSDLWHAGWKLHIVMSRIECAVRRIDSLSAELDIIRRGSMPSWGMLDDVDEAFGYLNDQRHYEWLQEQLAKGTKISTADRKHFTPKMY